MTNQMPGPLNSSSLHGSFYPSHCLCVYTFFLETTSLQYCNCPHLHQYTHPRHINGKNLEPISIHKLKILFLMLSNVHCEKRIKEHLNWLAAKCVCSIPWKSNPILAFQTSRKYSSVIHLLFHHRSSRKQTPSRAYVYHILVTPPHFYFTSLTCFAPLP
jgi:hypothetical protein